MPHGTRVCIMDIIQSIKDVWACAKKFEQHELLEKLADLKDMCYELRDENRELKEMLASKTAHNFHFVNNTYWDIEDDGSREGPYCSSCWDRDGKAIRMHILGNDVYECPACKIVTEGPNYRPPMSRGFGRRGSVL